MSVRPIRGEPALTVGAVSGAIAAVIALVVAFGIPVTAEQETAILGVVAALGPVAAAVWTRTRVIPIEPGTGKRMLLRNDK